MVKISEMCVFSRFKRNCLQLLCPKLNLKFVSHVESCFPSPSPRLTRNIEIGYGSRVGLQNKTIKTTKVELTRFTVVVYYGFRLPTINEIPHFRCLTGGDGANEKSGNPMRNLLTIALCFATMRNIIIYDNNNILTNKSSVCLSMAMTIRPKSNRLLVMAMPMPPLAPVTNATFPFHRSMVIIFFFFCPGV